MYWFKLSLLRLYEFKMYIIFMFHLSDAFTIKACGDKLGEAYAMMFTELHRSGFDSACIGLPARRLGEIFFGLVDEMDTIYMIPSVSTENLIKTCKMRAKKVGS